MRKKPSARTLVGTARTRKKPGRPYKRVEWLSDIIAYGKECTAERAWTQARNLAGLLDGLIDAMRADEKERFGNVHSEDAVEVPRWVLDGLSAYLEETYRAFQVAQTGRHTYWAERYRQDMVDFARFDAVHQLVFNHGVTWTEAYAEASKQLNGLAGGEPGTIEESYKRVRKAFREREYGRYYRSNRIPIAHLSKPSRKSPSGYTT